MVTKLLDSTARWLKHNFGAEAQLRFWVLVFYICFPLYFAPVLFVGDWLAIFIYWLSVAALHFTAMTGITAAETLVETRTDPSLQEAVNGGATPHDHDGADQGPFEAPASAPETEGEARES